MRLVSSVLQVIEHKRIRLGSTQQEREAEKGTLEVPLLHLGCTRKRNLLVMICDLGSTTEGIPYSESSLHS